MSKTVFEENIVRCQESAPLVYKTPFNNDLRHVFTATQTFAGSSFSIRTKSWGERCHTTVNGKVKVFNWCNRCCRYTTTHCTRTHVSKVPIPVPVPVNGLPSASPTVTPSTPAIANTATLNYAWSETPVSSDFIRW